jgi:hypothetical protein
MVLDPSFLEPFEMKVLKGDRLGLSEYVQELFLCDACVFYDFGK